MKGWEINNHAHDKASTYKRERLRDKRKEYMR